MNRSIPGEVCGTRGPHESPLYDPTRVGQANRKDLTWLGAEPMEAMAASPEDKARAAANRPAGLLELGQ